MDVDSKEEEGQFVYDVFIRQDESVDHTVSTDGAIGTLHIPAGAEDEWGGYDLSVGGEEDEKTQTDDEDSNAEDYNGADYPEDEDGDDDDDDDEYRKGGYYDDDDAYVTSHYDVDYRDEEYIADYDDQFKAMSNQYT
jgi:Transcription factor Iwr1